MSRQKMLVKQQTPDMNLKNPQVSIENTVEFMQKLTVVAVSCISYLRNIFPAEAFSERRLNGLVVRILRGDENIPGTQTLITWLKSAFDAVQLRFLKKMILVIQKQNTDSTLEVYTFNFSYNHETINCQLLNESTSQDVILEINSQEVPADIKKAAQQMIRSVLTLTTTMEPLPDNCELSMKLEFYDGAPVDYKLPKCFKAVDSLDINFNQEACTLKMGKVETKFSTLSLSTKSVLNQVEEDIENKSEDEVLPSQTAVQHSMSFVSPAKSNIAAVTQPTSADTTNLSEALSSVLSLKVKEVKCICECDDPCVDDLICTSCSKLQHRACYKVLDNQQVENHVCVNCHEPSNSKKICTDPNLINDKKQKEEALYRRALKLCLSNLRVSANTFVNQLGLSRGAAGEIFSRLEIDGCFHPATGKGNVRTIKTNHLKDYVLNLYFNISASNHDIYNMDSEENNRNIDNLVRRKRNSNQMEERNINENILNGNKTPKRMKYFSTRTTKKF